MSSWEERYTMRAPRAWLIVCLVARVALAVTPVVGAPDTAKVGLVFDVGGRGDLSFNDMAYWARISTVRSRVSSTPPSEAPV